MAEDQGRTIAGASIAIAVVATAALGLRIFARRLHRTPLRIDDYLIVAALE